MHYVWPFDKASVDIGKYGGKKQLKWRIPDDLRYSISTTRKLIRQCPYPIRPSYSIGPSDCMRGLLSLRLVVLTIAYFREGGRSMTCRWKARNIAVLFGLAIVLCMKVSIGYWRTSPAVMINQSEHAGKGVQRYSGVDFTWRVHRLPRPLPTRDDDIERNWILVPVTLTKVSTQ